MHTYHKNVSGVLSFLFVSYKSRQGWAWFKKTSLKKTEYREMKKYATTISEGTIAKGFIEARPEVHQNITRAHTSLCAVETNVLRQQAAGRSSTNLYFHYKLP